MKYGALKKKSGPCHKPIEGNIIWLSCELALVPKKRHLKVLELHRERMGLSFKPAGWGIDLREVRH